jgi:uncharacterized protein (DUF1810 family)
MTAADPFNLERFVTAQEPVFETVLAELRAGRKRSHWMWFIFPQLAGLGRSSTARLYGISSIGEARAYLAHKLLGPRLELCTRTVTASEAPSLHAIFGTPDDLKFRSCMICSRARRTIRMMCFSARSTAGARGSPISRRSRLWVRPGGVPRLQPLPGMRAAQDLFPVNRDGTSDGGDYGGQETGFGQDRRRGRRGSA